LHPEHKPFPVRSTSRGNFLDYPFLGLSSGRSCGLRGPSTRHPVLGQSDVVTVRPEDNHYTTPPGQRLSGRSGAGWAAAAATTRAAVHETKRALRTPALIRGDDSQ
jgi:hypothetical protein